LTYSQADLSRLVSHALRHAPWEYKLDPEPGGWVDLQQLVCAFRLSAPEWRDLDIVDVTRMISFSGSRRHEIASGRIRALYGHSIASPVVETMTSPPERLYHGTSDEAWIKIRIHGLVPMSRQFVHLSTDVDMAYAIGLRKSRRPKILLIAADEAAASGIPFYEGGDRVWLVKAVPPIYIAPMADPDGRAVG